MRKIFKTLLFLIVFVASFLISSAAFAEEYIFTLSDDFNFVMPMSLESPYSPISERHGIYLAESFEDIEYLIEIGAIVDYEPDSLCYIFDYTLDDDFYSEQTNLSQIGVQYAWNKGYFGDGVKIAIIDSGFCATASDFTLSKIHKIADYSDTALTVMCQDTNGHGTALAGIIAAQHNERGVAGIAPQSDLYIYKCFAPNESGNLVAKTANILASIYSAIDDEGCDIINMSFGGTNSTAYLSAANYAESMGVLLIAAAGNDGVKSSRYYYPASHSNVISVGSVQDNSHRTDYSQRNNAVNIMAPGEYIYSVALSGYSNSFRGTSFSAPQVTAAAALVMSANPSLTAKEITQLLYATADKIPDLYSGYGILNIERLIRLSEASATSDANMTYIKTNNYVHYSLNIPNGFSGYVASYESDMMTGVSSSKFGRLAISDFDKSKLIIFDKNSLSLYNEETTLSVYMEE